MIKGLDNGYMYTKDNSGHIFKSAFSTINKTVTGSHEITIDNKTYYVGIGEGTVDVNKIDSELNKVCTLTNLAMEPCSEFQLGVGLPIGQYAKYHEDFKEKILSYNTSEIVFGGKKRTIMIKDVIVFPQGAAALYSKEIMEDKDCIIVDIGGLTIDVAYIEFREGLPYIVKSDTWYKGMRTLFSNVIEAINLKFDMQDKPEMAEKYLREGIKIYGEEKDISFLSDVYIDYITPIIYELRMNYPSKTVPVRLCGGGAGLLYNTFLAYFSDCKKLDSSQFANAEGLFNIANNKFTRNVKEVL